MLINIKLHENIFMKQNEMKKEPKRANKYICELTN